MQALIYTIVLLFIHPRPKLRTGSFQETVSVSIYLYVHIPQKQKNNQLEKIIRAYQVYFWTRTVVF